MDMRQRLDDESLRMRGILAELRKFNPDEPRIPGGPHGGEWGKGGGLVKKAVGFLTNARKSRVEGRDRIPEVVAQAERIGRRDSIAELNRRWEQGDLQDTELQAIGKLQGFDALPTVGLKSDVDRAVRAGWIEVWRGVESKPSASAADIAERFRTGAYEPGMGIYGNGYYTSVERSKGEHFAGGKPEGLIRMALSPDAKILDPRGRRGPKESLPTDFGVQWGDPAFPILADWGHLAAARGWDAILISGAPDGAPGGARDQYIILNRSAVIVERAGG